MRMSVFIVAALSVLGASSCGGGGYGPSAQDINESLETSLQHVAGDFWSISRFM